MAKGISTGRKRRRITLCQQKPAISSTAVAFFADGAFAGHGKLVGPRHRYLTRGFGILAARAAQTGWHLNRKLNNLPGRIRQRFICTKRPGGFVVVSRPLGPNTHFTFVRKTQRFRTTARHSRRTHDSQKEDAAASRKQGKCPSSFIRSAEHHLTSSFDALTMVCLRSGRSDCVLQRVCRARKSSLNCYGGLHHALPKAQILARLPSHSRQKWGVHVRFARVPPCRPGFVKSPVVANQHPRRARAGLLRTRVRARSIKSARRTSRTEVPR